ncbi:MAG TPA: SusE domain-containing protein [Balneolaceae bacterium]
MKTFSTNLFVIAIIGFFVVSSCERAELGPVISSDPGVPAITSPESGQGYVLTEETAEDTLLTLQWTEPDYGFPSALTYTVEMGEAGAEFADPVEIGTTNSTSYSLTVGGMNNRMLATGYQSGQQATFEFRVVGSVNDSLEAKVSEPVSLNFTPYEVVIVYPEIYVAGSYQTEGNYGNDWTPETAPALSSIEGNNQYEGYIYIDASDPDKQFKFTDERTWDMNWGDSGADGTLDQNGTNIAVTEAGYYKINVDLSALTYTLTQTTTWGVIGDATIGGWNSDQDMTYDPATKVWTVTTDLTGGKYIKFRANDAWDLNYGDNEGDRNLEQGGSDILVEESGSYTITLNLGEAPYSYTLTKN